MKLLQKQKPRKSPGPDGVHPLILKNCADTLATSLCKIFNLSFSSGRTSDCWKKADIIPLHKKGAKNQYGCYRPVSLTSVLSKACEKIARKRVVEFWISKNTLIPRQFGFIKCKSCLHNFLQSFMIGPTIEILVSELTLYSLSTLHAYGIRYPLLSWVRSFLTNHHQRFVLRGHYSSWTTVLSGVPQETILGPILFIIYINFITRNLSLNYLQTI